MKELNWINSKTQKPWEDEAKMDPKKWAAAVWRLS
jgi:hypothetical protein